MQSELLQKRDPYFFFCSRAENLENTRIGAVKLFGGNEEEVALIKLVDVNICSDSADIKTNVPKGKGSFDRVAFLVTFVVKSTSVPLLILVIPLHSAPIVEPCTNIKPSKHQGCIFRLPCSHPELTEDHVLTSAYVKFFRTVTRNAVNKGV